MSILIYGIKIGKYFHQFLTLPYPPIVIFSKIGLKSKSGFVWTFFQKTKWTHVSVKNLDLQVSNPKNIATVKVYFSSFPYGTPCMYIFSMKMFHENKYFKVRFSSVCDSSDWKMCFVLKYEFGIISHSNIVNNKNTILHNNQIR